MSNDRLWIKCKNCGERTLLAKFWPGRWNVYTGKNYDPAERMTELEAWMNCHTLCDPQSSKHFAMDLGGDPLFVLETDNRPLDPPPAVG